MKAILFFLPNLVLATTLISIVPSAFANPFLEMNTHPEFELPEEPEAHNASDSLVDYMKENAHLKIIKTRWSRDILYTMFPFRDLRKGRVAFTVYIEMTLKNKLAVEDVLSVTKAKLHKNAKESITGIAYPPHPLQGREFPFEQEYRESFTKASPNLRSGNLVIGYLGVTSDGHSKYGLWVYFDLSNVEKYPLKAPESKNYDSYLDFSIRFENDNKSIGRKLRSKFKKKPE